mmetsp:Transcript_23181/g.35882  ORF Transcript_23181/g.35882 Transcript_23181/m.35882 type:complete len:167 (+) Transcript_23181:1535-2035(+)|eukprot:CAMPEP_0170511960 /NCGR_PEP_ID=MMETSP0208-20121228/66588_1 /TAXON_ID=197538 /ORGANISM="Strombidium inclinatum, Strain S3" /LENGTH=166 /DNA_ID=CAMNT_0010795545 /DNA_START=2531 /DNA_END=3031 /DNA_ORIENTATION=-
MAAVENRQGLTETSQTNLPKQGDPFMMSKVRPTTSHISKKALDDNARFIANSSFRMTTKSNVNRQIIGIAQPYLTIDKSKLFSSEQNKRAAGPLERKKLKKSNFVTSRQPVRQVSPKFQSNNYFREQHKARQDFMTKFRVLRDKFAVESKSTNFRNFEQRPTGSYY